MPYGDPAGYLPNVKRARLKRVHSKLSAQRADTARDEPLRKKLRQLRSAGDTAQTRKIISHRKRADFSRVEGGSSSSGPSRSKAREMLRDGTVHGRPLSKRQRGLFGAIASARRRSETRDS